jgi:hypothetical protein
VQRRWQQAYHIPGPSLEPRRDIVANLPLRQFVLDDAVSPERRPADLELRLDEADEPGAKLIGLIKPQFEAGRAALGRDGVVKDELAQRQVCDDIASWLKAQGWSVIGLLPSPLQGGSGNREFLIAAEKSA